MTVTGPPAAPSTRVVPAGAGEHYFFLNHLATLKAGGADCASGLAIIEFTAPRGFGPPLHVHAEEDEVMYLLEGEIRLGADDNAPVVSAGATVILPPQVPHTWQVTSDGARFLTINAGQQTEPGFDRFVAAMGDVTDPNALPAPVDIDPAYVAQVCAAHGITVLGPPPPPLPARTSHTVLLEVNCHPGKGTEFLPLLRSALADTRARRGAGPMEPYADADNPDRVLIWEKWATRADQESYLQWRQETGFLEALGPYVAEPPRILHLHPAE